MTVEEAARLRGFRRGYVLDLIRADRLRPEVLFRRLLVRGSELERVKKQRPGRRPDSGGQHRRVKESPSGPGRATVPSSEA